MFEKFTIENSGDFRQRYMNTYGFFTQKGTRTLVKLHRVVADGRSSHVRFVDKDGIEYVLNPNSEDDTLGFEFLPPKCAFYNTLRGVPLLVSRIPARQYQRGICDKNTSIQTIRASGVLVDFPALIELFATPVTPQEALEVAKQRRKEDNNTGVAISPQFAIGLTSGAVKCFNVLIGRAELDKADVFHIRLDTPALWTTELTDAFRRANLKVSFA